MLPVPSGLGMGKGMDRYSVLKIYLKSNKFKKDSSVSG